MPSTPSLFRSTFQPAASPRPFSTLWKRGRLLAVSGVLALTVSGAWGALWAQAATSTNTILTVTSGGSAATTVSSGSVVTLTAKVTAGTTPVTPGQVNFCDATAKYCSDIHLLGTAQLTSAGTATLKFRPGIGSHSYKAVFVGTKTYAGSSSSTSALAVTGKFPSATVIAQSGNPGDYTLTATVGVPGSSLPTGTVSFLDTSDGNKVFGTAVLGAGSANFVFFNSDNPAAGNIPTAVAVADFNGDGIPDMAVANNNDGTVTILLGNGDGTFKQAAGSPVTVGSSPSSVTAGDFNGDGAADLAVANKSGSVSILIGKGDGTFSEATGSPIALSGTPDCIAVGDFNGDGKADLAVIGAKEEGTVYSNLFILLGDGDGTFTPVSGGPVTIRDESSSMAVADFNGDSKLDLAVAGFQSDGLIVLLGNGDGTFTETAASPIAAGAGASGVAAADFNRDGRIDLALSIPNGAAVSILLGNGDGTFTQASQSPIAVDFLPWNIEVGDFNGDGIADLAASNGQQTILVGKGDGTFEISTGSSGNEGSDLAVADFNGDGLSDLITSSGFSTNVSVLLAESAQATATLTGGALTDVYQNLVDASYAGDNNYGPSLSKTTTLIGNIATPVILPASGTFTSAQSITITDSTPGATIYFEASGATNTNGFIPYTGSIPMAGAGTLKIQAYATGFATVGYIFSQTVTTTYALNFPAAVATPVFSLAAGSYAGAQTVTISDTTPGATIYYTTNGTYPNISSTVYSGKIAVSTSEIVMAVAIAPGYANSAIATAQYLIDSSSSRFIYAIAGNYTQGYTGDGGPATFAEVNYLQSVAVDSAGNVYMADTGDNVVRKVAAGTGIITTIAGTGVAGNTGDNGPAASAELWTPAYLAVDPTGNLFIAEKGDFVVRRIDAKTGNITTFAGNPATNTGFDFVGIACDHLGNLYIAEYYSVFEVNAATGKTSLIQVSTGKAYPEFSAIAVDSNLNVYVSGNVYGNGDYGEVWKVNPQGVTTVFAGGSGNSGGDGGPATSAGLYYPAGLAVDAAGNVYIADTLDYAIREVNPSGIIDTVAGIFSNPNAQNGDGSPATDVYLYPANLAIDTSGNLYVAYWGEVKKITAPAVPPTNTAAKPVLSLKQGSYVSPQTLTMTDATPGAEIYVSLNGVPVNTGDQGYHGPIAITGTVTVQAMAIAPGYLASAPVSATYTITTQPTAVISTVAGNGTYGFSGAGGPAINAEMERPEGVALDGAGNLYIADSVNYVVWMVAANTGKIAIVAGTGAYGRGGAGDGGLATAAAFTYPSGVALDKLGNLYIADEEDQRIRMVAAQTGIITTVAGPGPWDGTLGDGGPATSAFLASPYSLAFDSAGNLYIAGPNSHRIRMIAAKTGIITTVAGGGTAGQLGDGGLATAAYLPDPEGVALDSSGNLYISDGYSSSIRKVEAATGVISTIAGNGTTGATGDGGPATAAEISPNQGIVVDGAGSVYLSDLDSYTIRKVDGATGNISTIAGDGYFGFGGDGGAATMAELYSPQGLAFDASGSLYIADAYDHVVRKVAFAGGQAPSPTFSVAAGTYHSIQTVSIRDSFTGAAIYYTTDGNTPTTASNLYSGSIAVSASETLQAIAVATGYTESAVAKAAYTIDLPTPVITWPTPAPITYGTALSATQLDATTTVDGMFAYTPALATVLTAGSHTLSVTFTPTDMIDHTTATASVTLQVNQAKPSITWPTPAPITYGTALSATQLDATTTVAGSFAYVPALGTVLSAGTQTLKTTFTPTDTTNYTTATDSVQLTVNNAAPTVSVTPSSPSIFTTQALSVAVLVSDGSGNPKPTGAVTLTGGGYTSAAVTLVSGAATIDIPANSLSAGSDKLTVTYTPDSASSSIYSSATGTASETVNASGQAATTVTVTPSSTNITNQQSDAVSITVAGAGTAATGTVTLSSGSYTAQQTLAGGAASFTIPAGALSNGANTLAAAYSGDATYNSSAGTASVTVSQVVAAAPVPTAVNPGTSATATLTLSAGSTYAGTMNMACTLTSSPTGAQDLPACSLSPASVTLTAGGSGTTQLTVTTTASSTSSLARPSGQDLWRLGGGAVLAAMLMFGIPTKRRRWLSMLALFAVVAVAGMLGCGGGQSSSAPVTNPGTTAGVYAFTVTGTDSANTTITTSTTVKITVQ